MRAGRTPFFATNTLFCLSVSFVLGTCMAAWLPTVSFTTWCTGSMTLGIVTLSSLALRRSSPATGTTFLVAVTVLFAGACRFSYATLLPADHFSFQKTTIENPSLTVKGRIDSRPIRSASGVRFSIALTAAVRHAQWHAMSGRLRVSVRASRYGPPDTVRALAFGDVVVLTGRVRSVPKKRNPADFDYENYLRRQQIYAVLWAQGSRSVLVVGTVLHRAERAVLAMQRYARKTINECVRTSTGKAVLHALVLGDRRFIEDDVRGAFARTGLMHVLAVSGLHVFLVGMIWYELCRSLLSRTRLAWLAVEALRSILTLLLLTAYLLLTGGQPSVARSVLMTVLIMGATLAHRTPNSLNVLGGAAIVILAVRPQDVLAIGFQLSFSAVWALVALSPVVVIQPRARAVIPRGLRPIYLSVVASLVATLGTMPAMTYHFGQTSFAGLLLNTIAIPLTMATLAAGLMAVCTGGLNTPIAFLFGGSADLTAEMLVSVAEQGARIFPWLVIQAGHTDGEFALVLTILLVAAAVRNNPRIRVALVIAFLVGTTTRIWFDAVRQPWRPTIDVVFFDVGHGDAALVRFPQGNDILIDVGLRDGDFSYADRTLLPHLVRYGVRQLDAVIISHPHNDHLGGLPVLLKALTVRRVIQSEHPYRTNLVDECERLTDSLGVRVETASASDTLFIGVGGRLQILSPSRATHPSVNDASIVVRLVYGTTSILFTGDVEREAERAMVARYAPLLGSTVVKVPHHGSGTSSTPTFVRAATPGTKAPTFAVVSVDHPNKFGLPNEAVLRRWQAAGFTVVNTASSGAIWLRSDGLTVRPLNWR